MREPYNRLFTGTLWFVLNLIAGGCTSHRYSTTLRPGSDPALTHGTAQFVIFSVQNTNSPLVLAMQRSAETRYPALFSSDWTAIPLNVDMDVEVKGLGMASGSSSVLVPFLIPCAWGLLPVPSGFRQQYTLRATDLANILGP